MQKSLRVKLLRTSIDSVVFRFHSRVLFRFLVERILFKVLSDRVFFESSDIGSSSLGSAVIDCFLHQCSFSAMSLIFLLNRVTTMFCFAFIIILTNN